MAFIACYDGMICRKIIPVEFLAWRQHAGAIAKGTDAS